MALRCSIRLAEFFSPHHFFFPARNIIADGAIVLVGPRQVLGGELDLRAVALATMHHTAPADNLLSLLKEGTAAHGHDDEPTGNAGATSFARTKNHAGHRESDGRPRR